MKTVDFSAGCSDCRLLIPDGTAPAGIVYLHCEPSRASGIFELLCRPVNLVCIGCSDWNADLSPWPAGRAFKGGEDFAGKADEQLSLLTGSIVSAAEAQLSRPPLFRGVAGYSLAGLFSVYALFKTDLFTRCASMSGSLWYDNFLRFMQTTQPKALVTHAYFSVGDREGAVRNQRLARVEECTRKAETILHSHGADTAFVLNPGNHFVDSTGRIAAGIDFISRP